MKRLTASKRRHNRGSNKIPEMLKRILHLFLLVHKLRIITDMHQLAPPANAKITANRLRPVRRRFKHLNRNRLDIALLHLFYFSRNPVTNRKHPAHHHRHAVVKPPETLLLLRQIRDRQLNSITLPESIPVFH